MVPDLSLVLETFVRICPSDEPHRWRHLELLRSDIAPLVAKLRTMRLVGWFSFLIHDHNNGVPAGPDDRDIFWHLRLEMLPGVTVAAVEKELPSTCEMTQPADPEVLLAMSVPDASLLCGGIGAAWELLGEQSEWLLRVLAAYQDDAAVSDLLPAIDQYLHYFANMTQREVRLS